MSASLTHTAQKYVRQVRYVLLASLRGDLQDERVSSNEELHTANIPYKTHKRCLVCSKTQPHTNASLHGIGQPFFTTVFLSVARIEGHHSIFSEARSTITLIV